MIAKAVIPVACELCTVCPCITSGIGYKDTYGHTIVAINRQKYLVYRLVYQMCYGAIPQAGTIRHKCHNQPCVNPHHLYVGPNLLGTRSKKTPNNGKRLSDETVKKIKTLLADGETVSGVARKLRLERMTVQKIKLKQSYVNV